MPPAAEKKIKVVMSHPKSCDEREVMRQRGEMIEQNINFFRQEMAERWRLQETADLTMRESISGLSESIKIYVAAADKRNGEFLDRVHKLEKNLIYVAITVVVAAIVAWLPKVMG